MRLPSFKASFAVLFALSLQAPNKCAAAEQYAVQKPPLDTDYTYKVGTNPWGDHPRPQLKRQNWETLNGIWTYQAASGASDVNSPPKGDLAKEIMIPSCVESGLSGIQELNVGFMWFRRNFTASPNWKGQNFVLNFEAVDYEATVFLNGAKVGHNVGGYNRFSVDVTESVKLNDSNDLLVFVRDPTDAEVIPVGKQAAEPSHIFYRACSGIWQTVWMESVPNNHIQQLDVHGDMAGLLTVKAHTTAADGSDVEVIVTGSDGHEIASGSGQADQSFSLRVPNVKLWSPESPVLYNLTVSLGSDRVQSYTAFRSISSGFVNGIKRPLLNGNFVFLFSPLDQGFWPDGLYLPPSPDAMKSDIRMLKGLGFNMIRKHIKYEPDLFYRACDEIGMMVMQDMPSLPSNSQPNSDELAEFNRQFKVLVNEHLSYPSIVAWVIYNEGWGQVRQPPWPEADLTSYLEQTDGTRLINSITGWYDHGYGDFSDNHHYANPQCGTPFYSINSAPHDSKRIGFQGEFGGIGHEQPIAHSWNVQQSLDQVNHTYEIDQSLDSWNYRAHLLLSELRDQVERFECSGGVWTQTSDVEGEVNGLVTYDRRVQRTYKKQWQTDIQALYDAAKKRSERGKSDL